MSDTLRSFQQLSTISLQEPCYRREKHAMPLKI